jgi:hypothetical protein
MQIPVEVQRAGREAVESYKRALPYGEKWAAMVALQVAPGTSGSDRAFMEGRLNNQQLDDMPVRQARYVAAEARQAGIGISGKYYVGGLADKRGWRDPEAWVSSNDEILKVAHKRRLSVAGTVNYDPGAADPQRKLMSESSVREAVRLAKRKNPEAKTKDLRAQVIEKHAYRAKGRGV